MNIKNNQSLLIIISFIIFILVVIAYYFWQEPVKINLPVIQPIVQNPLPNKIIEKPKQTNNFFSQYIKLHRKIFEGKNYNEEIVGLKSDSDQINNLLANLEPLAEENIDDNYFAKEFSVIIRDLYNYNNFIYKYIFIRPTGNRAIEKGGIDNIIEKIDQYLKKNDLNEAEENIEKLTDKPESLKEFQRKLQKRIMIKGYLNQIDQLIEEM